MKPVEFLAKRLPTLRPYPECMPEITPKLSGRAFFPGGFGRADNSTDDLPRHPVMIVGQDFGTIEYWNALGLVDEPSDGTWAEMLRLLESVAIDPSYCFFTNAIMGIRRDGPITGEHPAFDDREFIDRCLVFLGEQIEQMRPSVVVLLGTIPAVLFAAHFSLGQLARPKWRGRNSNPTWSDIDREGLQFIERVPTLGREGETFACACVIHPANRKPNLRLRSWPKAGLAGEKADVEIWRRVAATFRATNEFS